MRYLLDSQCLYAAAFAERTLPPKARSVLGDTGAECFVSPISVYELELKKALGKLSFPDVADWWAVLRRNSYELLPVAVGHSVLAARLPMHHRDPWDRLLIAQAMSEGLVLIAGDRQFSNYNVTTIW